MRVLQLIDSLRPGGAERMAVNYANALVGRIDASFLCCTRLEGNLKKEVRSEVGYLFLKKEVVLDLKAFFRLRSYILDNRIDLIQAHGSSYFLAVWVKLSLGGVKLIWHDHWGERASKKKAPAILKKASLFFDGIIAVNQALAVWAGDHLYCQNVTFIRNFLAAPQSDRFSVQLQGEGSFRIICVANFRREKDHLNLLKALKILINKKRNLSLHLVGADEENSYSKEIKDYIRSHNLNKKVVVYGVQENISGLLDQADLGVLSSVSEGLPVALLEYGMAGIPVVATNVGEISQVVGENGKLVPPNQSIALAEAITYYVEHKLRRREDANNFRIKIEDEYSETAVMPEVINFYNSVGRE